MSDITTQHNNRKVHRFVVHTLIPLARGSTAEADAARPEGGGVLDPKEEVAEEATLDAIVPVLRVGGESLAPHVARDADILLMAEVEALEEVVRGRGGEVDPERLWAGRPVPLADAGERLRGEHGNEVRLVLVVRVEHQRLPQLFTKDWMECPATLELSRSAQRGTSVQTLRCVLNRMHRTVRGGAQE